MKRSLFNSEHTLFRESFVSFLKREVVPHQEAWRESGCVDRRVWNKAGEAGFLVPWLSEAHGGPGGDFLHSVIVMEELAKIYESGFAMSLHSDIVVPYIHEFGNAWQHARWLPGCASGELVSAIAMTEPGTGSDLAAITTTATRDGDHYVLNGAKTFISNGISCDICIVAAKTGDGPPHSNISLFVVEAGTTGFVKGKQLKKMGMASQDTSELFFEDCRVPVTHLLGEEGQGFLMLMRKLQQERLCVGVACQASARQIVVDALSYCQSRKAFSRPISKFQNTKFKLVDCMTQVEVGEAFLDRILAQHLKGEYLVKECSMSKLWHSEMLGTIVDTCLQFYGGYGYMDEYPISRAYVDARVQRIYAGTNEIMRVIIAKELSL